MTNPDLKAEVKRAEAERIAAEIWVGAVPPSKLADALLAFAERREKLAWLEGRIEEAEYWTKLKLTSGVRLANLRAKLEALTKEDNPP